MNEDDLRYRRCQVQGCEYKELRGLWRVDGKFVAGKFVCPKHYEDEMQRMFAALDDTAI